MAWSCSAGAHISKSQLLVCVFGFVGFTILALGTVSDYWTTYGIISDQRPSQRNGNGSAASTTPSGTVLSREGLWRVCYQYVTVNSSTVTIEGHMCYFGLSIPSSMSAAMSDEEPMTRYGVGYLIASWVLIGLGAVLTLAAVVMSMAALRQKKNQSLIRGVAAIFILAFLLAFLGLVLYAVRRSLFLDQWPDGESPYASASLGWSYGVAWVGILLSIVAGLGHLWVIRRYEDSML